MDYCNFDDVKLRLNITGDDYNYQIADFVTTCSRWVDEYCRLPVDGFEFDETLESCGERELKEETSLQSKSLTYLGTIRELQEDHNFIHFAYLCNQYEGVPVTAEPDKCAGWEWYSLDSLPENILPGHKTAIEMYIKKETLIELLEKE
jgi:ADP-ribose pyrophosphatase YjhB (NUDIX family)